MIEQVSSILAIVLVGSLVAVCVLTVLLSPYTIYLHMKAYGRVSIRRAQARELMEKYLLYRAIQYVGMFLMSSLIASALALLALAIVNQRQAP